MQRGSIPKGNNTYTILINLKDGTQLKGTCYLDLQAPGVTARSIEWKDADTIEIVVNSDEAGTLYYAIQDEVEGEGTIAAKDPAQIYASGETVSIGYGLNYITVKRRKGRGNGSAMRQRTREGTGRRSTAISRFPNIPSPLRMTHPSRRLRV